jgi:hypothetical protein
MIGPGGNVYLSWEGINNMKRIYLCAPYTSPDPDVIKKRVELVNKKAAELMDGGYNVFSPISHSHPISEYTKADALEHDFWLNQDLPFMEWCEEVWVYILDGWRESKGIKREITEAYNLFKPVRYIF